MIERFEFVRRSATLLGQAEPFGLIAHG